MRVAAKVLCLTRRGGGLRPPPLATFRTNFGYTCKALRGITYWENPSSQFRHHALLVPLAQLAIPRSDRE